jgi:hypothetical protein
VHFAVYEFIPQIIHSHPLLGLGLNTFSVYYQFATGKSNWGPALVLRRADRRGRDHRHRALSRVPLVRVPPARRGSRGRKGAARATRAVGRRVLPLAWGYTAALAGTMAANFFYLTMSFYYFYAFAALALALPIVFGGRARFSAAVETGARSPTGTRPASYAS